MKKADAVQDMGVGTIWRRLADTEDRAVAEPVEMSMAWCLTWVITAVGRGKGEAEVGTERGMAGDGSYRDRVRRRHEVATNGAVGAASGKRAGDKWVLPRCLFKATL